MPTRAAPPPRATRILNGTVVVRAERGGLRLAEAVGIARGRVVAVGERRAVAEHAAIGAQVIDVGRQVVVPGLHDAHLHLVGMARARREVALDGLSDAHAVTEALRSAARDAPPGAWLRGRGWREGLLDAALLSADPLLRAVPAIVYSHDAHSAWASPEALRRAGLDRGASDPPGGRIERAATGELTGVLRERAGDRVEAVAGRVDGEELRAALDETIRELHRLGVTGCTDAGDALVENGIGRWQGLGDRASRLMEMGDEIDGRLRLTVNVPAAAIEAAAGLGLRTGAGLQDRTTLRAGWAKAYADGALGSRTAALFAPYTCGDDGQVGLLRLEPAELDDRIAAGRRAGINLAIHAIGDRAVAAVLDAYERNPDRAGGPMDRVEHLQLVREEDQGRLAELGVVASLQPIHAAADREQVARCWADRSAAAYPWRGIASGDAVLALGSDAPIESPNPWLGLFAAVHRRFPYEPVGDWHPEQALTVAETLAGYTVGPARMLGLADEGHLEVGARADLAVLNVEGSTLEAADERLVDVRAVLTMVDGQVVHGG
jgi:hypothetical protein